MEEWTPDEIFLNDESIANWEHPAPEGSVWMKRYDASTELLASLWYDTLNKEIWKYRFVALVAKFRARIQRANKYTWMAEEPYPAQEEILLSGSINILENGEIPWTDFSGYDLRRVWKIWTASAGEEESLHEIILGKEPSEYAARIDSILRWYEKQDEAEQARQDFNSKLRRLTS